MKKYRIDNECMRDILILYCEGKSYLWNAFFCLETKPFQRWKVGIFHLYDS